MGVGRFFFPRGSSYEFLRALHELVYTALPVLLCVSAGTTRKISFGKDLRHLDFQLSVSTLKGAGMGGGGWGAPAPQGFQRVTPLWVLL